MMSWDNLLINSELDYINDVSKFNFEIINELCKLIEYSELQNIL